MTKTNIFNRIYKKGFTVVELLVVIAVIGVLATIVVVAYNGWKHTTLVAEVQSDLNGAAAALESAKNFSPTGYPADVNTIFTHSNGVTLTGGSGDGGVTYCIDAAVTGDASIAYYLATETKDQGPQVGTCASKPGLQTVPTVPTALVATVISSSEIDLSWTAPSMGSSPITYTIQRATDSAFVYVVGEATQSGTTRASVSLSSATNYFYRVMASNSAGSSGWSNTASGTTGPAAPTGLIASAVSTTSIQTSWANESGVVSYNVQKSSTGGFTSPTTHTTSSLTSTFTGMASSTNYYFRVQSVDSNGIASPYTTVVITPTYTDWSVYTKFVSVGDWNVDGNNDIVAYKSDGTLDLHLGAGNGTFGPAITLTNIGTIVRDIIGPGRLPSQGAPIVWWDNTDGKGYFLQSNSSTGITGSAVASGTTWNTCTTVFAAPFFYTNQTVVICESSALTEYGLNSAGTPSLLTTYGSGWNTAYGVNVFGTGDFSGDGTIGDVAGISAAGAMTVYPGTGSGTTGTTFSGGSGWLNNYVTGGRDFNGDGHPDLLRYVTTSGILYLYLGSGTSGGTQPYFLNGGASTPLN